MVSEWLDPREQLDDTVGKVCKLKVVKSYTSRHELGALQASCHQSTLIESLQRLKCENGLQIELDVVQARIMHLIIVWQAVDATSSAARETNKHIVLL